MSKVFITELPDIALSARYQAQGAFVDCYYVDIAKDVSLQTYIQAFYTTPLFKLERSLLSLVTLKHTKDSDAVELSLGKTDHFSFWTVEGREINQILLRDLSGNTRSWLMVEKSSDKEVKTRLFFGSVVVPKERSKNGKASFGLLFHLLDKFHKVYSRALISAAYRSLSTESC